MNPQGELFFCMHTSLFAPLGGHQVSWVVAVIGCFAIAALYLLGSDAPDLLRIQEIEPLKNHLGPPM